MATTDRSSPSLDGEKEKQDAEKVQPNLGHGRLDARPSQQTSALELLNLIHAQDDAHPIGWPVPKKWLIVTIYCMLQVFVTLTSTTYVSVEFQIQEKFGGSTQVLTLGQSMFIVGNAVGPAFLGRSWRERAQLQELC